MLLLNFILLQHTIRINAQMAQLHNVAVKGLVSCSAKKNVNMEAVSLAAVDTIVKFGPKGCVIC